VTIELPPLRHRWEDLPILVEHFLAEARKDHPGSRVTGLSREALARLYDYPWPGNVRELAHIVERGVLLANGPEIQPDDLPPRMREAPPSNDLELSGPIMPVRELQRRYARWALERLGGNKARTASELGVDIKTLNRWLANDDSA